MDGMQPAPQFELPKPLPQERGEFNGGKNNERIDNINPEIHVEPISGERMAQAAGAVSQAVTALPATPIPMQIPQVTPPATATPSIADDTDIIEKVWIDKAKRIVTETQGDPYRTSKELNYLKKDYIEKRFGKSIIVPKDESASS